MTTPKSERGEYAGYARWELRHLARQFDGTLLHLQPARHVQVRRTGGDGVEVIETTCTSEDPDLWWPGRDERAGLYLARVEDGVIPTHPHRRTESFAEDERARFARFALLLAAFVIREHEHGETESRRVSESDWADPDLAASLRGACRTLARNAGVSTVTRALAASVANGSLVAAGRGSSPAGRLEIELVKDAAMDWVRTAVVRARLLDQRVEGRLDALHQATGELLLLHLEDPADNDDVRHRNLGQFVTESDPDYIRAVLRDNCSMWCTAGPRSRGRRRGLALATLGLCMVPNAGQEVRAWRSMLPRELDLLAGATDLPDGIRALARRLRRFPEDATSRTVVDAFWQCHDGLVAEVGREDPTPAPDAGGAEPGDGAGTDRRECSRAGGLGTAWNLRFGGLQKPVPDSVGMRVIAELLSFPNVIFSAQDLDRLGRPVGSQADAHRCGEIHPVAPLRDDAVLPPSGVAKPKARYQELEDVPPTDDRTREMEEIKEALFEAHTPDGRPRAALDDHRRVTHRVRSQITRTRKAIGKVHEALAAHLAEHIRTKQGFAYEPPNDAARWLMEIGGR